MGLTPRKSAFRIAVSEEASLPQLPSISMGPELYASAAKERTSRFDSQHVHLSPNWAAGDAKAPCLSPPRSAANQRQREARLCRRQSQMTCAGGLAPNCSEFGCRAPITSPTLAASATVLRIKTAEYGVGLPRKYAQVWGKGIKRDFGICSGLKRSKKSHRCHVSNG